ncbi:MAG: PD40 domain-containing protein [Gemmatimonadetes bacterium]|nr:PD40 domain-containing protein [Gemmatimonadota bacterium]
MLWWSRFLPVFTGGLVATTCDRSAGPTPVVTLEVAPAAVTLVTLGDTVRLVAVATGSGWKMVWDRPVEWRSRDTMVATVSATGLVTAVGNGRATVTANAEGVEGSAEVLVGGPVVTSEAVGRMLRALAEAQRVLEVATGALANHPVVQSLVVLGPALSLGSGTLRELQGATFVYSAQLATYERDTARRDAPPNGARFALYQVAGGRPVLPLQETGYVDVLLAPEGDTALAVQGRAGGAVLQYDVHGFDRVRFNSDSSRADVVGAVASMSGAADFSLRETFRGALDDTRRRRDYQLTAPEAEEVTVGMSANCVRGDCIDTLKVRIAIPGLGDDPDSITMDVDVSSFRGSTSGGVIRRGADTLIVRRFLEPYYWLGILRSNGVVDTIFSDTVTAFWNRLAARPRLGPGDVAPAVTGLLSPAMVAFRATTKLGGTIKVVTVTSGAPLDPDGYRVTLDDSTTQSIGLNDSVIFSRITTYAHRVELHDVAANCVARGYNPRKIDGLFTGSTVLRFEVGCATTAPRRGQLLFQRSGDSYVINADGSGLTNLTANAASYGDANWSPDGSQIAFASSRGAGFSIYRMSADGTGVVRLTDGTQDLQPRWSPDGSRIVFNRYESNNSEIYVMGADGSGLRNLTNRPRADDGQASWSPDGSLIVFSSYENGDSDIYVMKADGSGLVNLTNRPTAAEGEPSWSPDGSRIAFVRSESGNSEIYAMLADGSGPVNLTNHPANDYSPAWSPAGSRIAFGRTQGGVTDIYAMNPDGSGIVRLTTEGAFAPVWSPEGDRLASQSYRDGSYPEIYIMDEAGSWVTRLTHDPASDFAPRWRP